MLPHSGQAGRGDTTVEGRLACLSDAGYLPVAQSSAQLGEVLDRIKVRGRAGGWQGCGGACIQERARAGGRCGDWPLPCCRWRRHRRWPFTYSRMPSPVGAQENLRREQRAIGDLNCATVTRILSPLQAAHYIVGAYPAHCDALALRCGVGAAAGRWPAPARLGFLNAPARCAR